METVDKAMWYLFILGIILVGVAYYAGSTGILNSLFSGVNALDLTATGRNQSGVFAAYPAMA